MNATRAATALCNARVLTPDGFVEGLAVLVQDGLIVDLVADGALPAEAVRHDLQGATLLPGGSAQQLVTTPATITMVGTPTYYSS